MAATLNSSVEGYWTLAFERCKSRLPPKELARVLQINTYEQLKTSIEDLRKKTRQKSITKTLTRLEPFLQNLKSFEGVIGSTIQSNPNVAALCWGGIKLVLELSLRLTNASERIATGMCSIGQILPRFETYQSHLPLTPHLTQAMVSVYEAVVEFCFETIKILRKHPMRNMFRSLWNNYEDTLHQQLDRIERQSRLVDCESSAAKLILDETRHDEVKMLAAKSTQMPGKLPCYSIPIGQNMGFFGRVDEMQDCRNKIKLTGDSQYTRGLALYGVGGVGKTSIALQIAHEEKSRRSVILWMAADDTTKLNEGFVESARKLDLHQPNANAKTDRDTVKGWLERTSEPWFLIFDNVEKTDDVCEHIPVAGNGSYMITSRNPDISYDLAIEGYRISSFDLADGREFLFGLLPGVNKSESTNWEAADTVTKYLGGSALGLKQIGGFLRETRCSFEDLLALLQDKEQEKQFFEDTSGLASLGYSKNLANAWRVSLSALDETTMNLLLSFSFMDPDRIPDQITKALRDSCCHYPDLFPGANTNVKYLQCRRTLIRYGLIESFSGKDSFTIHRLVQATALHFATQQKRDSIFNAIIEIFLQGHPQSQATSDTLFNHWSTCAIYAPHLLRLQNLIKEWRLLPKSSEKLWILFFNCSRYLLETGAMAKALSLIEDTEPLCDVSEIEGQIQLSYLQNARGLIALQHQRQEEARSWFEPAFAIRKRHLGELNVNTVAVEGNLALTLINERRWEDLIVFNEPRRDSIEKLSHIPIRLRSPIYDLLSSAYLETGQLDKAWEAIEMSTNLTQNVIPVYSQLSGYIHLHRGDILYRQGHLEDALREHSMGLDIRKKVLGDHVQTAVSCYRTAVLMICTGKCDSGIDLLHESRRMYGNLGLIGDFSKGGEARSTWQLGRVMKDQGKMEEAEKYDKEARELRKAMGQPEKDELCEADFNVLLNYVDS